MKEITLIYFIEMLIKQIGPERADNVLFGMLITRPDGFKLKKMISEYLLETKN